MADELLTFVEPDGIGISAQNVQENGFALTSSIVALQVPNQVLK